MSKRGRLCSNARTGEWWPHASSDYTYIHYQMVIKVFALIHLKFLFSWVSVSSRMQPSLFHQKNKMQTELLLFFGCQMQTELMCTRNNGKGSHNESISPAGLTEPTRRAGPWGARAGPKPQTPARATEALFEKLPAASSPTSWKS